MSDHINSEVPAAGQWPVGPQEQEPQCLDDRIWVDGCWDFFHHGDDSTHDIVDPASLADSG